MRPSELEQQEKDAYKQLLKRKLMTLFFVAVIVAFIFAMEYLSKGGGR